MEQARDGTVGSLTFLSSYNDDHQHDDCDDDDVMVYTATSSKKGCIYLIKGQKGCC
jgi:hypothetical protein